MNTESQESNLLSSLSLKDHIFFWVCGLIMVVVSIYLTNHYFQIFFPEGLASKSACNISSFFNCDTTTQSNISNIMGVPISLFGLLFGVLLLLSYLFHNKEVEGTNHILSYINLAGCIGLFLYSLIVIRTICPFCSLYYIGSAGVAFFYWRKSKVKTISVKILLIYAVVVTLASVITYNIVDKKKSRNGKLAVSLISQYKELPNLGTIEPKSPYMLIENQQAPVNMVIFSDFQCPACKMLSDTIHPLLTKYKGKIDIQYSFYPLDINCNASMTQSLHPYACKAAYIASCSGENFLEVHDKIFNNQKSMDNQWLDNLAKDLGVTECMNDPKTKEKVVAMIEGAKPFNVKSTPTFLLNGKKIEGVLPSNQLYILIDHIIEENDK